MLILLPLFVSLTLYLLKEKNDLLLTGISTWILILIQSSYWSFEFLIIILISILTFIWIHQNENGLLGLIFLIGSWLSLISTSIISLFIAIEILSMTILIIINLYIQDQYAGILYYLFSGLFSALFLLSLGYLSWGWLGANQLLSLVLFAKIGLVPFHLLLPNIYNNLSPKVLLLIDIPYKMILFLVLYRIHFLSLNWNIFILASLILGSLGSIRYKNLLSIWIYSSLYNYGLILILINYQQIDYLISYFFIYSLTTVLYFYLINEKYLDRQISDPIFLIFWFLILVNLIGIPPLNGFFIKFWVLYLTLYHHSWIYFLLASLGILFLTYTYLRILISILINSRSYTIIHKTDSNANWISILLILSLIPLYF